MKHYLLGAALFAVLTLMVGGCTNTTSDTISANKEPGQKSYTRHELERTGQAQPGSALRFADPDVGR